MANENWNGTDNFTYRANDGIVSSNIATVNITVNAAKEDQYITFGPLTDKAYGDADFSVSATASSSLAVSFTADGSCSVDGNSVHITGAGSCTITASQDGDENYYPATPVLQSFNIAKASSSVTVTCPETSQTYTGSAIEPCTASYSGVGGLSGSLSPTYADNVVVGTATASASYAGDANHEGSSNTATFEISKASSAVTVTCPETSQTYTGSAIEPCTASYSGVGGLSGSLSPTYADNVVVGTAMASASYAGDANHEGSSNTATFEISKASSAVTVTCPETSQTYTGSAIEPCTASYSGVGGLSGSLSPTYADNVVVGTATASASYAGDANHEGSSNTATFEISKASSAVTVTCPETSQTYTGSAIEPCTASYSGVGGLSGSLSPTYADNVVVGTATASASYAGDANHEGSSNTATFEISKASSAVTVTCPETSQTYTGSAIEPCTASYSGVGGLSGSLSPTYADNVVVGTATASASYAGDANHEGSSNTATFEISKASSAVTVTCPETSQTYTGSAIEPCTASYSGVGGLSGSLSPTYADNVVVGTAMASASYAGDANHEGSSNTATFEISKASSAVTVTCPETSQTYTGSAIEPCTASYSGVGGLSGSLSPTYADNVVVGTATASASYAGDANHEGSSNTATFEISKASSAVTVTCPETSQTYTGSAIEPCTASYSGVGGLSGSLSPTYADNVVVGTATASASYAGDANHEGSSNTATFEISKASSAVTVTCPETSQTYTGSAIEPCTASYSGVGGLSGSLSPTYADNVVVGTATASASYAGDANHEGSSNTATFEISKASSAVTVTCPETSQTYTGSAIEPCTASYSGVGGLSGSLSPTYADNVVVGTAMASASYAGDANHEGSSNTATFEISKASSAVTVTCPETSQTYTGSAIEPCTASYSGVGGLSGSLSPTYADNVVVGTATASASYAGDANHEGSSNTATFEISKASSAVTVTCPETSQTYTGSAIEPCTVLVTGANLSLTPAPVYADNINVGTASASYTYAGDANHTGSSGSDTFEITKASTTTVVSCTASEVYTGSAIEPCTVSVTGANLSLTPAPVYADNINVGTASASYTYAGDANHTGSSGSDTFEITKASTTTVVSCSPESLVYKGLALTPCTVSVTGANLNLTPAPVYADNINVGTASASYTYAGDANHTGSSGSDTFEITKALLTVTPDAFTRQYSDPNPDVFTFTYSGWVNGENESVLTTKPTCTSARTANDYAGQYDIICSGGVDNNYKFEYVVGILTGTQEDAYIEYSGDSIAKTSTNLTLRATVWDSAAIGYGGDNSESGPSATIGDITKMWIVFKIYPAGSCGSGTPITKYAQVSDTGISGDGIGTAVYPFTSSSEASFCVIASLVAGSGGGVNQWYMADLAEQAGIAFYNNTGQFASGGGWIVDPNGKKGNFGFNARYNKRGQPQGQMVYVFRGYYNGVLADFIIKSNALDALSFSGTTYPIEVTLQGKCNLQINRASDGVQLWSDGNCTFIAKVIDTNSSSGIGSDSFQLSVWDKYGIPYKIVAKTLLSGGNVIVRNPR